MGKFTSQYTFIVEDCPAPPAECSQLIAKAYNHLVTSTSISSTVDAIDKAVFEALNGSNSDFREITKLLFRALLQMAVKNLLRKKTITSLRKLASKDAILYREAVSGITVDIFHKDDRCVLQQIELVNIFAEEKCLLWPTDSDADTAIVYEKKEFIDCFFQSISKGIEKVWKECSSSLNESCCNSQILHRLFRSVSIILQREHCSDVPLEVRNRLLTLIVSVADAVETPLDLRISSGVFAIHLCGITIGVRRIVLKHLKDKLHPFDRDLSSKGKLSIYLGILCCSFRDEVPGEEMTEYHLIVSIYNNLFSPLYCCDDETSTILFCRVYHLLFMSLLELAKKSDLTFRNIALNFGLKSPIVHQIRDPIWLLWDHYLDSVKHLSREIFQSYLKLQNYLDPVITRDYCVRVSGDLVKELPLKKMAYSCLRSILRYVGVETLLETNPKLPVLLVRQMSDPAYASYAVSLLDDLFSLHYSEVMESDWHETWFWPFFRYYREDMLTYGYEDLLQRLLRIPKLSVRPAIDILLGFDSSSDKTLSLLILCAKIIFKFSMNESLGPRNETELWKGTLPYTLLIKSLQSSNENLRGLSFSLICENPKSTALFDSKELPITMSFIQHNLSSQSPSFRQKFLNNFKKMLSRINDGIIMRRNKKSTIEDYSSIIMPLHEEFIKNLFNFLIENMHPNANYPRTATTLSLLELMYDIVLNPKGCFSNLTPSLVDIHVIDTLISNLDDSYESNKIIIFKLLNKFPHPEALSETKVKVLVDSTWALASSLRPSEAITASYILNVIVHLAKSQPAFGHCSLQTSGRNNCRLMACNLVVSKLKEELKIAQDSIAKAASSAPMYGLLLCLRNIISGVNLSDFRGHEVAWADILKCTIELCLDITNVSSHIVKHDSPEGHLPLDFASENHAATKDLLQSSFAVQEFGLKQAEKQDDLTEEEVIKAHAVCAQMLLLCGWRSVKEVALLLGTIVKSVPFILGDTTLISSQQIEAMKILFLDLLIETKHRGAFEQTHVGFKMFCEVLWKSNDARMNKLPELCLKDTLHEVRKDVSDKHISPTRRSGGIPFIVQAILASQPVHKGTSLFEETMADLWDMTLSLSEQTMHAYNILRGLLRETKLRIIILPHCSKGIKMALHGYKSGSWAIRNAASLLFSALTNRMFGVKKEHDDLGLRNSMSAVLFFETYSNLYEELLDSLYGTLLEMKDAQLHPKIYLVLLLLGRLSPSSVEIKTSPNDMKKFIPGIIRCCAVSDIRVRMLAARALVPFIRPLMLESTINDLCKKMTLCNQNEIHGVLLCLDQLFTGYHHHVNQSDQLKQATIKRMASLLWVIKERNPCHVTRGAAFCLYETLLSRRIIDGHPIVPIIRGICINYLRTYKEKNVSSPGYLSAINSASSFLIAASFTMDKPHTILLLMTDHPSQDVRRYCWNYVLTLGYFPSELNEELYNGIMSLRVESGLYYHLMFDAFSKAIANPQSKFPLKRVKDVAELLMEFLAKECNDTALSCLVEVSGHLGCYLIEHDGDVNFDAWYDLMLNFSCYEGSSTVRIRVAEAIENFLPPSRVNTDPEKWLKVTEVLLNLLNDDDIEVQLAAVDATHCFMSLYKERNEDEATNVNSPQIAIQELLQCLANDGSPSSLGLLFCLALKEEEEDLFGLSQEDDRAFEKGEINIYREEFQQAKHVAQALQTTFQDKHFTGDLIVDGKRIYQYLLFGIGDCMAHNVTDAIPLQTLVGYLVKDIEFILGHLCSLTSKAPFCIQRYEHWCCRLACRAIIYYTLGCLLSSEPLVRVKEESLLILQKSIFKPKILKDIFLWLTS